MALLKECPACRYRNSARRRKCLKCGHVLGPDVVYWVDVWVLGKRVRERIGPSYTAAKTRELALKLEKTKAKVEGKSVLSSITRLEDLWPRYYLWARSHNRSPKTKKFRWVNHLKPAFGNKIISEISPRLVEEYKSKRLSENAKPSTINKELTLLKHILNKAVEWGYLEENPIRNVKMLPENSDVWKYLTKEEFALLEQYISENYRDLLVFLVYTGLRLGDALKLRWEDVDLEADVLYIRGSKSGKSFGLPIHPRAKAVLLERKGESNGSGRVFPHSPCKFRQAFKKALKEAGLPDIRIHDLRHTFASWLALEGVPIQQIQQLLGHSSIQMTLRYSHLNPAILREAVQKI